MCNSIVCGVKQLSFNLVHGNTGQILMQLNFVKSIICYLLAIIVFYQLL